jgi:hypothetical protein
MIGYWQGKTKILGRKNCPNATLSATNHTWTGQASNFGLRGVRSVTTVLSSLLDNWGSISGGGGETGCEVNLASYPVGM